MDLLRQDRIQSFLATRCSRGIADVELDGSTLEVYSTKTQTKINLQLHKGFCNLTPLLIISKKCQEIIKINKLLSKGAKNLYFSSLKMNKPFFVKTQKGGCGCQDIRSNDQS